MKLLQSFWRLILASACLACLSGLSAVAAPADAASDAALDKVLSQMDDAADKFHTTEASVVWDQFQKIVDEHEEQKEIVYFRRDGKEIQMVADIMKPE
jgi:hypothetical protein